MKRTVYTLRWPRAGMWLPVSLLIGGLLASCGKKEAEDAASLPDGKYPLQLTAEVAQPQTRAGGKNAWTGGEEIRVSLEGVFGNKTYVMDASGNASPKDADNAFYWKNTDEARVSAWTPDIELETDISDQSGGYAAFDVLYASAIGRYDQAINLRFIHRMAKIEVILKAGEGITEEELEGATVTIFGDPLTHSTAGLVSPGDQSDGEIKPYYDAATKKYEALVPPQDMTGKPLIRISIGSNDFTYTPETEAAGKFGFFGGKRYAYTITVKADGIDVVTKPSHTWTDGGEENVAIARTLYYTADEVKAGDYIYSDGTTSDGGLRTRYPDGRAPVIADPKPQPIAGKTVAGIVFWVPKDADPTGRQAPANLTDDKVMASDFPDCTHGLAVSLEDIQDKRFSLPSKGMSWVENYYDGSVYDFQKGENFTHDKKDLFVPIVSIASSSTDNITKVLGYQNTQVLLAYNDYCNRNGQSNRINVPVAVIETFKTDNPAPKGSTGWFFPSVKELHILCAEDRDVRVWFEEERIANRNIVNTSLSAAGGEILANGTVYWSSLVREEANFYVFTAELYENNTRMQIETQLSSHRVRAVCAF